MAFANLPSPLGPSPLEELCALPEVKSLYLQELRSVAEARGLQGWEVPVDILLEPHPFTTENGLLTSTFKQCRPGLERRYRTELEEVYRLVNDRQMERCAVVCAQTMLGVIL